MIKKWNRTGKIKAIILGLLAFPNLFFPIEGYEHIGLTKTFIPFIFACLGIPLIVFFNKAVLGREIKNPTWNDNPLTLKYPLSFFHFGAFFFIVIGFSILIGTGIKFQTVNNIGLSSLSFGLGIITGNLITLSWKKVKTYYFIIGGIGLMIFIIYSFLFLIRSYTKDEDIIKYFSENFDKHTVTANKIIVDLDSINLSENIKYSINKYDKNIDYTILKYYIYREKTIQIPEEDKLIIAALFDTINCSHMHFMKNNYYRFKTDLRNWHLNHIYLVKIINDRVFIDHYEDWEIIEKGGLPTKNKNWLYHLSGSWYFESKIKKTTSKKEDYPHEGDLSEQHSYYKNKKLKSIGRHYSINENGEYHYLKHGKWVYLDSNEYIMKEEIYCFDSLIFEKDYDIDERSKIEVDSISTKTLVNGKWVPKKIYIFD